MKKKPEIAKNIRGIVLIMSFILLFTFLSQILISNALMDYPEKEYKLLENEIYNIFSRNGDINMDKLSDDSIKYTIFRENSKKVTIFLEKDNAKLKVKYEKLNDFFTLELSRERTENEYKTVSIGITIGLLLFSFIGSFIIIFFSCYFIMRIEENINKRKVKK